MKLRDHYSYRAVPAIELARVPSSTIAQGTDKAMRERQG